MLQVDGLCTEYHGDRGQVVKAAQDVSFLVEEGRLFTLLGPSGCGKTTTLRSIAGLERPRAGEITVNGRPVYSSAKGIFVAPNRLTTSRIVMFTAYFFFRSSHFASMSLRKRTLSASERLAATASS